jgi:hypothetical protein
MQGKEVRQRPCQEGGRRSDVGAILALVGASFLGALTSVALGPFLPMIARDLRTSVPLLGQTATAALLSAAVLGLIVGPLADRYGHRRLLLAGLWAVTLCGSATAAARGYLTLLGGQLLGSVSIATLEGVALAVAGARFVGRARRRAMSAITACDCCLLGGGPPAAGRTGGDIRLAGRLPHLGRRRVEWGLASRGGSATRGCTAKARHCSPHASVRVRTAPPTSPCPRVGLVFGAQGRLLDGCGALPWSAFLRAPRLRHR